MEVPVGCGLQHLPLANVSCNGRPCGLWVAVGATGKMFINKILGA